jgi:hypothetical protein
MSGYFVRLVSLLVLFTWSTKSLAQPGSNWGDFLKWNFSVKYEGNCEATLSATAKLATHWHIFSLFHDPNKADFIGVPTTLTFKKNKNFELIGKVTESKKPKVFKDEYGEQLYHEKEVTFSQKIRIKSKVDFTIDLEYEFQICDENGCLFPPAQDYTFQVKGDGSCEKSGETAEVIETPVTPDIPEM